MIGFTIAKAILALMLVAVLVTLLFAFGKEISGIRNTLERIDSRLEDIASLLAERGPS